MHTASAGALSAANITQPCGTTSASTCISAEATCFRLIRHHLLVSTGGSNCQVRDLITLTDALLTCRDKGQRREAGSTEGRYVRFR